MKTQELLNFYVFPKFTNYKDADKFNFGFVPE